MFLDIKKAFDAVSHEKLIEKLDHYGIRGIANSMLSSYLDNRKQYVSFNNINSSTENIKCGVPQGSILGPLVFLIYINDLPNCLKTDPRFFADDTALCGGVDKCLSVRDVPSPSHKALLCRVQVLIDTRPSSVLNHYHFDLFLLCILIRVKIRTSTDVVTFFFAFHLILSSYFDVVETRTRLSRPNAVNTCYSASLSNFP